MFSFKKTATTIVLDEWRTHIFNAFMAIAVIVTLPVIVLTIYSAIKTGMGISSSVILLIAVEGVLIILAMFRRINYLVRVIGLLIIGCTAGVTNFFISGFSGPAPIYLILITIFALILIGKRAGVITCAIGVILLIVFAILIANEVVIPEQQVLPIAPSRLWAGFSTIMMIYLIIMVLLLLFYRFQERVINAERKVQADLNGARVLLEEQNINLERIVEERTAEYQAANKNLGQRNAELMLLNNLSRALTKTLDVRAVARTAGDNLREIFDSDGVAIMLMDPVTRLIHSYYEYDKNEGGIIDYLEPFPIGTGLTSKVILTGQPLLLNTLEEEIANGAYFPPELVEGGSGTLTQSWLGVPIVVNNETRGLVFISDYDPYAFEDNHLKLLQTLSSTIGVAIENASLFGEKQNLLQETERKAGELQTINSVQKGLSSQLDLGAIYELIGEKVRQVFKVDVVDIVTYDETRNLITMPYSYERGDRSVISPCEPYGFRLEVINSGNPILINQDFEHMAAQQNNPVLTGSIPKSALYVPLIVQEKVRGILSVQDLDEEDAFSESDVRLLQTLASSMAAALENAWLYTDVTKRVADLAAINSVGSTVVGELDLNSLIAMVGEQIRTTFNADVAYVALMDEDTGVIRFPYSYGEDDASIEYGEGITSQVLRSGQPLLINENISTRMREKHEVIIGNPSLSYIGVPIIVRGKPVGVISVQSTQKEGAFDDQDLNLLNTIAAYVGPAVQNARLFNRLQREKVFSETLITTSPVAIVTLDEDNLVKTWNPAAEKLYGYSRKEAEGRSIVELVSNEQTRPEALEISAMISSGKSVHSFVQRSGKNGRPLDLEMFAVPVAFAEKRIGTFVMYHDITELKSAENAILESERRLADIIDFLPDATMVIDREGKVIAWNRAIEEMTGIKSDHILGKGNYEYAIPFYGERRPILIDLVLMPREEFERGNYVKINRVGELLTGETYTPGLKQGSRYLFATATLLHDSRGNVVGAAETIRDITDRKIAEEELQKAKEAADAANKAKSAFLANMSHELRTPLNAIIGFTRIVRRKGEESLPEKQLDNLDKVLFSAEHLLGLINTTLDIAKIEAGRMDVLAANFRIGSVIDQCVNTSQPLIKTGVVLEKQADDNLNLVYSDQDKIRQIVLNLLSNAAKFTHQGRILLSAGMEGEDLLSISVEDTGIGISEEALPRIFKEFQQADLSTTRQYGGTGLGLSISRRLAKLLGGDLTVKTQLGKGSRFTLTIPMQYRGTESTGQEELSLDGKGDALSIHPDSSAAAVATARKHVMVIDNDPDAIYLLQESLGEKEFEIFGSRTGAESLRLAAELKPQAILLDILMPDMDGWQILNDLKTNRETADIPVILLTIVDKKALGFRLGASAYLLKPIDPAAVKDALDRVILSEGRMEKHVLVVDDDPSIADLLRQYLPEDEYYLESARDGVEALTKIEQNRPDILLLDLIMPRMDGFGVIEKLRADPLTCDLPIIVISAKELTQTEVMQLKRSVSMILKKQGFEGEHLSSEINRVLSER